MPAMSPELLCRCKFCNKQFQTQKTVNQHISASKICHKEWRNNLVRDESPSPKRCRKNLLNNDLEFDLLLEEFNIQNSSDAANSDAIPLLLPPNLKSRLQQTTVEDAEDEDEAPLAIQTDNMNWFVKAYPGLAGKALRQGKTPG